MGEWSKSPSDTNPFPTGSVDLLVRVESDLGPHFCFPRLSAVAGHSQPTLTAHPTPSLREHQAASR